MGSYQSPYSLKSLATLSHASDMIGAIADKIGGLENGPMPLQVKFMGSYQSPYSLKSLATLSHASDMIGAIADKIGGLEDSEKRFR
ncbi:TPA: hypothetical protein ACJHGQ_000940 [Yersinia enterocolitica]